MNDCRDRRAPAIGDDHRIGADDLGRADTAPRLPGSVTWSSTMMRLRSLPARPSSTVRRFAYAKVGHVRGNALMGAALARAIELGAVHVHYGDARLFRAFDNLIHERILPHALGDEDALEALPGTERLDDRVATFDSLGHLQFTGL